MAKNLLLMSSSRTPDDDRWLGHAEPSIKSFLRDLGVSKITLIPYAAVALTHDQYASIARDRFKEMGFALDSVHESDRTPSEMVQRAEAIAVAGGNTFMLTRLLRVYGPVISVMNAIRDRVLHGGIPYLGWSAGTLVACPTIRTTNDMPIVQPSSFNGLGLVPFQINAHYRSPPKLSEDVREKIGAALEEIFAEVPELRLELDNRGETRDQRIIEFMAANNEPVLALREGGILKVTDDTIRLEGTAGAKLFRPGTDPIIYQPGDEFDVSSIKANL